MVTAVVSWPGSPHTLRPTVVSGGQEGPRSIGLAQPDGHLVFSPELSHPQLGAFQTTPSVHTGSFPRVSSKAAFGTHTCRQGDLSRFSVAQTCVVSEWHHSTKNTKDVEMENRVTELLSAEGRGCRAGPLSRPGGALPPTTEGSAHTGWCRASCARPAPAYS